VGLRRGEIWWANLELPAGRRPILLLSRDDAYLVRELIIIAPVTTRIRNIPSEVLLTIDDGMPKDCVINLDSITTIPRNCLIDRIAILSNKKLMEVDAAIHFSLGM
jgi:mRNA interferase MazF